MNVVQQVVLTRSTVASPKNLFMTKSVYEPIPPRVTLAFTILVGACWAFAVAVLNRITSARAAQIQQKSKTDGGGFILRGFGGA